MALLSIEVLILLSIVVYLLYKWATPNYDIFSRRGLPFVKPVPFFGNSADIFLQRRSGFDVVIDRYNYYKDEHIFGLFELRRYLFGIRDPELIKQITVKDFDHFINRRGRIDEKDDAIFGNSLFALRDQKWKDIRSTMSPAFTGNKMRLMFELIEEVSRTAIDHLKKEAAQNEPYVIEMRDFFTRFTSDVIGSAAFGLQINSLTEKDNEFYKMTRQAINFSGINFFRMLLFSTLKPLMKLFKVSFINKNFKIFLRQMILDTMKYREEHNIIRPDMINLLMAARKGALKHEKDDSQDKESFAAVSESSIGLKTNKRPLTDDDVVAQCFIFILAGFEPTATTMGFCAQELTENPEIQKKLISEIDAVRANLKGSPLTYEILQKMEYMDMVLSETLRKWPAVNTIDRQCTKPYTLYDSINKREIKLDVGDPVWIPIAGIHRDPKYYPNPSKFDPERFNEENRRKIHQYTYLPFGAGPRNCIGSRFAIMETKAAIFHLLSHFTFEVSEKTQIPLKLRAAGFNAKPETGFWVHLKPRSS